jgi:hypothetical protein
MKKLLIAVITSSLMLGLGIPPSRAADKEDDQEAHFKKRADQINAAAQKPGVMQVALKTISVETGVPLEKVRLHHQRHPDLGAAGLLLANVMAAETKKPPAEFLKDRQSGEGWLAIARENKVPVEKLNVRLNNLWKAIAAGAEKRS